MRAAVGTTEAKNDASDILPSLVSEELTTEQELRVSLEARWLWGRVFCCRLAEATRVGEPAPPDSAFRSPLFLMSGSGQSTRAPGPLPSLPSPALRQATRKSTASIPPAASGP